MIFIFVSSKGFPDYSSEQVFMTLFYIHFVLLQISFTSSTTDSKIKEIHAILRKISYNRPNDENIICLDVNLHVTKYNCGLFDFDWTLIKMVKNSSLIN